MNHTTHPQEWQELLDLTAFDDWDTCPVTAARVAVLSQLFTHNSKQHTSKLPAKGPIRVTKPCGAFRYFPGKQECAKAMGLSFKRLNWSLTEGHIVEGLFEGCEVIILQDTQDQPYYLPIRLVSPDNQCSDFDSPYQLSQVFSVPKSEIYRWLASHKLRIEEGKLKDYYLEIAQ